MMIINVELGWIDANPWQTRRGQPDEQYIRALADDIRFNGLLQTPVGRLMVSGASAGADEVAAAMLMGEIPASCRVELAFGHNRLAAYKLLRNEKFLETATSNNPWEQMPVELRALTDEQMAVMAWSENEKRRDVTPLERALAIQRRMDSFRWTQERAAEVLGISRPAVGNALRLLKLPADLQDDLHRGAISERQSMALLRLYEVDPQQARLVDFDETRALLTGLALQGESSEKLRLKVDEAMAWFSAQVQFKMAGLDAPEVEKVPAANAPAPIGAVPSPVIVPPPAAVAAPEPEEAPEPEAEADPEPAHTGQEAKERNKEFEQYLKTEAEPEAAPVLAAAPAEQKTGELTWAQSTITLTITLWPDDNDPFGRLVVLGARLNEQPPAMQMMRMSAITLPEQLAAMLDALKAEANKK